MILKTKSILFFLCVMLPLASIAQPVLEDANADQILELIESQKGEKAVLLNVWATWCGPCREEFPYLMDLKKKYSDQFKLILVSGDFKDARSEAIDFLEEHGVDFTTYFKKESDQSFINKLSDNWTGALPFTVIVGMNGEVTAQWEDKADFSTFEKELLKAINQKTDQ